MLVSTRGRYALRVMIDLAENSGGGYVPMREVARRQGISLKYLERILPMLVNGDLVEGVQGKGGGYRLSRSPGEYTVGEILRVTGDDTAPVACLKCGAEECARVSECRTLPMWTELNGIINDYLDNVTLLSLMKNGKD